MPAATARRPASQSHELAFDPERHAYTLDGASVPAVTTVTRVLDKPGLDQWRARVGLVESERIAREAANFGTALHAAAAIWARGGRLMPLDLGDRWQPTLDLLLSWLDRNVVEVLMVEETMASPSLRVAGKTDLVCRLIGHKLPTIIDYKTGRGVYEGDRLQQAAYRTIVREWAGITCDRLIIHLPAPEYGEAPQLRTIPLRAHGLDEQAFRACLALWHWHQGVKI
jgi:hypothetical protein